MHTWQWTPLDAQLHLVVMDCFRAVDAISRHELPIPLHTSTLESLSIPLGIPFHPGSRRKKRESRGSGSTFASKCNHSFILYVLVNHRNSCFGLHVEVEQFLNDVRYHSHQSFFCCLEIANSQPTSSHATSTHCHAARQKMTPKRGLSVPFPKTSTLFWRMLFECLNSARGSPDILHFCQQSEYQVTVDSCLGEKLGYD